MAQIFAIAKRKLQLGKSLHSQSVKIKLIPPLEVFRKYLYICIFICLYIPIYLYISIFLYWSESDSVLLNMHHSIGLTCFLCFMHYKCFSLFLHKFDMESSLQFCSVHIINFEFETGLLVREKTLNRKSFHASENCCKVQNRNQIYTFPTN